MQTLIDSQLNQSTLGKRIMDESLEAFSQSRQRTIFSKRSGEQSAGDAVNVAQGADPLYPSLDAELPEVHRPVRSLYRPSWDPRDRWRQMLPSQPLHAPPESFLPAQFRYEDLKMYTKSETMGPDQDRLLNWLMERFYRSLEFRYTGQPCKLTADEAVRDQVFTPLQILDEQLQNLGLSSADQALLERRKQLVAAAKPAAAASEFATTSSSATDTKRSSTWEQETNDSEDEFSELVTPVQQIQQAVITVHELEPKGRRRRQPLECGDVASDSTIECQVDIRDPQNQRHHQDKRQDHRVGLFGDVPSSDISQSGRKLRMAENAV